MMARWLLTAALLLAPCAASALDPARPLQDYHHTTWTAKDGAPTNVDSMTQTADGWLWLSNPTGLYRFDGVRFERYTLPGPDNPLRRRVTVLRAMPNGDLLMSFFLGGGLSVLHPDGSMTDLAAQGAGIDPFDAIIYDEAGNIWIATPGGMHHYSGGKWRKLGPAQGLPPGQITDLKRDRHGRMWALGAAALYLYESSSDKFIKIRSVPTFGGLLTSPDGRIWIVTSDGAEALPAPTSAAKLLLPADMPGAFPNGPGLFDRDGNLWSFKCPIGLCLTANAGNRASGRVTSADVTSRFDQPWQMSSLNLNLMLEDREGSIWIATRTGLERFRDTKLAPVHIPDSGGLFSLNVDSEGQVWAVDQDDETAWKLSANAAPVADRTQRYRMSATDRHGALLLSTGSYIERRYKGAVEKIPLPAPTGADGKPLHMVVLGMQDDGAVLWMMSPQTGLMAWADGRWRPRSEFRRLPRFVLGAPDRPGESWLALQDGTIMRYSEQQQPSYDGRMIGLPTGMFTREQVIAAGGQGIAVFKDNAFHKLQAADPEVLLNVSGLAITSNGDRWLNGGKGLVHVRKADWMASMAQPSLPLRYELISVHDGYRGEALLNNRLASMRVDKEDRLWLAGSGGVMWLDTRNIRRNPIAPQAGVYRISTLDGTSHAAKARFTLPAGTHSFNIHYSAPSLRLPEQVRFQYRLDGEDDTWQDAGSRRTAFYTNMSPGKYRFSVRAANEDGVWSAQPAVVEFEIPSTFVQTPWFKGACLLAGAAALHLLYQYRLRIVTARLEERMEVRLAERERIARTLHDTFLQTVQGVVLRLDATVDSLPGDSATRAELAPIVHSARAGIDEGRAQVQELRSTGADEVECRLRDAAVLLAASHPGVQFALRIDGARRTLRAGVVDEISEIGREAVRNAYQHAQAAQIAVRLAYGADQFTLQVRDDGRGMPPDTAPGHWGLVGMRERAARIGAALVIGNTQENGCAVTITLPARRAYADIHTPWWRRLFGI